MTDEKAAEYLYDIIKSTVISCIVIFLLYIFASISLGNKTYEYSHTDEGYRKSVEGYFITSTGHLDDNWMPVNNAVVKKDKESRGFTSSFDTWYMKGLLLLVSGIMFLGITIMSRGLALLGSVFFVMICGAFGCLFVVPLVMILDTFRWAWFY
jgi:hypothetical protein